MIDHDCFESKWNRIFYSPVWNLSEVTSNEPDNDIYWLVRLELNNEWNRYVNSQAAFHFCLFMSEVAVVKTFGVS